MGVKLGLDIKGRIQTVFENRVLRIICGTKRNQVVGDWRKLHNEDLMEVQHLPFLAAEVTRQ
jgi:hypothetical protein